MRLGNLVEGSAYKCKLGNPVSRNPVSRCSCQTPMECKFLKQYPEVYMIETNMGTLINNRCPYSWFKTKELQKPQDMPIYKSNERGCCSLGFNIDRYHQVIVHRTSKNEVFLTWENVFNIFDNSGNGWTTQNPNKKWWCGHERKHKISIDDYINLSTLPVNCNNEIAELFFDKANEYFGYRTKFIPKVAFCQVLVSKNSVLCLLAIRRFRKSDLSLLPKEIILMIARMIVQIEKADFYYKYESCDEECPTKDYNIMC